MYVELAVYGDDLEPELVTEKVGLSPSTSWRRGDVKNRRTGATRDQGCWIIATQKDGGPLEDHIAALIEQCASSIRSIRSLGHDDNVFIEVAVVVHLEEHAPDLSLSQSAVEWIASMNAALDMDLYLYKLEA